MSSAPLLVFVCESFPALYDEKISSSDAFVGFGRGNKGLKVLQISTNIFTNRLEPLLGSFHHRLGPEYSIAVNFSARKNVTWRTACV